MARDVPFAPSFALTMPGGCVEYGALSGVHYLVDAPGNTIVDEMDQLYTEYNHTKPQLDHQWTPNR